MPFKVLITDSIAPVCTRLLSENGVEWEEHLKQSKEGLKELVSDFDAWIIRSGTRIDAELIEAASKLRVIGRAGVGVDNVDLDAATRQGILVLNAPDGNTISTAEHTCSMLMALSRHIPRADASLKQGQWERKQFMGAEVYGKTLGIIGVGKIGRAVAARMQAYGMTMIGYDPVLSSAVAGPLGIELVSLEQIYRRSDYITIHTPLNDETRALLNRETLALCKKGVRLINCARGGIIDEGALLEALEQGQVAGAALDVYSQEPPGPELDALLQHPKIVVTPHIAASTEEAQEKVAQQVTEQVINALHKRPVQTPVNALAIKMATQKEVQPYLRLAEILGTVVSQLVDGMLKRVVIRCYGDTTRRYAEILTLGGLIGILRRWRSEPVNYINARTLAEEAGLQIEEQRLPAQGHFTNLLEIELETDRGTRKVAGTIFGEDDPRLVRIDSYDFEVQPQGHILFYANEDRPGMLAAVGSILAASNINIGALALGRRGRGLMALTAISVDEPIPDTVLGRIAALEDVRQVKVVCI